MVPDNCYFQIEAVFVLFFFGTVAVWVVVVDFNSNTSTAKLWLGLGLSLATKYKIIFAVRLHVLHECLMI